jgi:hypothetical protein
MRGEEFWLTIDWKIRWGEEYVCLRNRDKEKNKNDEAALERNIRYGPTDNIIRD